MPLAGDDAPGGLVESLLPASRELEEKLVAEAQPGELESGGAVGESCDG